MINKNTTKMPIMPCMFVLFMLHAPILLLNVCSFVRFTYTLIFCSEVHSVQDKQHRHSYYLSYTKINHFLFRLTIMIFLSQFCTFHWLKYIPILEISGHHLESMIVNLIYLEVTLSKQQIRLYPIIVPV